MSKEKLYETLDEYLKASSRLDEGTKLDVSNDIVFDGVIQRFKFTFELSWKLMKIFMEYIGISGISSPRGAIREAFSLGLIDNDEQWIDMMIDRYKAPHLYNEDEARLIYNKIQHNHNELLKQLGIEMKEKINEFK